MPSSPGSGDPGNDREKNIPCSPPVAGVDESPPFNLNCSPSLQCGCDGPTSTCSPHIDKVQETTQVNQTMPGHRSEIYKFPHPCTSYSYFTRSGTFFTRFTELSWQHVCNMCPKCSLDCHKLGICHQRSTPCKMIGTTFRENLSTHLVLVLPVSGPVVSCRSPDASNRVHALNLYFAGSH